MQRLKKETAELKSMGADVQTLEATIFRNSIDYRNFDRKQVEKQIEYSERYSNDYLIGQAAMAGLYILASKKEREANPYPFDLLERSKAIQKRITENYNAKLNDRKESIGYLQAVYNRLDGTEERREQQRVREKKARDQGLAP